MLLHAPKNPQAAQVSQTLQKKSALDLTYIDGKLNSYGTRPKRSAPLFEGCSVVPGFCFTGKVMQRILESTCGCTSCDALRLKCLALHDDPIARLFHSKIIDMTEVILVAWVRWFVSLCPTKSNPKISEVCWIIQKAKYQWRKCGDWGQPESSIYFALQIYCPQFIIWRTFEMACTYKKPQVDLIQNIYNLIKDRKAHTCLLHVHYVLSNKLRVLILTEAISRNQFLASAAPQSEIVSPTVTNIMNITTTYYHYHKVNAWSATVRRIYLQISSNPHRILLQKKTQPGFIPTDQVLKADGVQTTDLCENINQNTAILMAGHKHFYSEFQPKRCCDAKVWTQSMCLKLHLSWMLVCFGICLIATCPSNNASQSPYCIHQSTAKSECFPLFSPCCWKIHGQPAVGLNQRWRCSASPGFGSTAAQVPSTTQV